MAQRSYKDLTIELEDSSSAFQDISQYVVTWNGWDVERLLEEITGAGESADRWGALGFAQKNVVDLTGPYDDGSTATLVTLTKAWTDDSERNLVLTFDGSTKQDIVKVGVLLSKTRRNPVRGKLTEYVVSLRPTGAITTST